MHSFFLNRLQRGTCSLIKRNINTCLPCAVSSSVDISSDTSNAIKWLFQSKWIGVLFKSAGVAVDNTIQNKAIRRTSKMSIQEYLKQRNIELQCADSNGLTVWDNGLIVVGFTPTMTRFIKNCSRKYTFIALVSSTNTTSDLKAPLSDIISEQKIISHANSSSHGNLYLVQFKTKEFAVGDDAAMIIPEMRQLLSASGMPIIDRYISLTGVKYTSNDSGRNDQVTIDLSGESSSSNEQDLAEDSMKSLEIIYRAPSKFMKYIKREELAYSRLASTTNEKLTDTITYRDLQLTYPITSLRPRESSGVIVEACNKYLANVPSKPAILELGCASGALILAVLNENKGRNINGFGLDIDKNSLLYAEKNAKNNKIDGKVTFLDGDFTKLHLIQALSPPGDGNEHGYDVIVSNPPYFAQQKIVNRVTSEGKHVLSANGDGLEYYELILQSINLFYSYNKRHLLSPQGVVVLQIPGNKLSYSKVKQIIERNYFKVVEVIYDKRPRDGDATDMLIRGIVCQSASPAK